MTNRAGKYPLGSLSSLNWSGSQAHLSKKDLSKSDLALARSREASVDFTARSSNVSSSYQQISIHHVFYITAYRIK